MNRILKLTTFILCLELIVAPVAPHLSLTNLSYAQDCPSGTQFDSTLNRCITTEQMANIMNATANCSSSDKECYKANAERALKEGEEEGKIKEQLANKGGLMGTGMKVGAVAVPLFMVASRLFKGKKNKTAKCSSLSLYMMLGAGAAIFIGDMYANSKHKKRLKKIKEEWEGVRNGESSGDKGSGENDAEVSTSSLAQTSTDPDVRNAQSKESQAEAFEMLAKSEDSLASAANFKSTIYAVGGVAFAGASVMSLMEHMKLMRLKADMIKASTEMPPARFPAAKAAYVAQYEKSYCDKGTPEETQSAQSAYTDTMVEYEDSLPQDAPESGGAAPSGGTPRIGPPERYDSSFMDQLFVMTNSNYLLNHRKQIEGADSMASLLAMSDVGLSTAKEYRSPSINEYEEIKTFITDTEIENSADVLALTKVAATAIFDNLFSIQTANATEPPVGDEIIVTAPQQAFTGLNKTLKAPLTRAAIAGVFAAWSGLMFMHAKKQAKISKARAKYLRDRKDEFNDATGAISCTSADRNNVNNLKCYCYTSEGQRNSQRANSQACVALFTGRNLTGETNYLNGTGIASQKVCMTNSGIDENCACRSNNSCLSAVPPNFAGINPGSLGLVSSSTSPLNQLTSGQIAAASVNGAAAVSSALKLLDQAKKSQAKVPELANGKGDKLARDMAGSLIASSAGASAPQLSSPSSSNPFSLNPSQAAAALEKELKDADTGVTAVKGGGFVPQPGAGKVDDFGLEFGMTPTQLAADQNTLSQMNQNLDFGQNDINNSSSTNIFEVLSNRYQRSGMRRLFDEEGKLPADPAARTDITE